MHVYLTRWRLARGLAWPTHRPDLSPALRQFARGCGITAVLIVVYGLVGRLEYQDAVAAEAEARQTIERERLAAVSARNLEQAERFIRGCLRDDELPVLGKMIFECEARQTSLTTDDLRPEISQRKHHRWVR